MSTPARGTVHHVELWVPDVNHATEQWGLLLTELGYHQPFQDWPQGCSWILGGTYIVIEQSPDMVPGAHDRKRPGLNHLAFHAGDRATVDTLAAAAPRYGWRLLFPDRHPYAGGSHTYAAYLANTDGYKVELITDTP